MICRGVCAGLANIGLAVAAAYGLGAYLGLLFTPLMCATYLLDTSVGSSA